MTGGGETLPLGAAAVGQVSGEGEAWSRAWRTVEGALGSRGKQNHRALRVHVGLGPRGGFLTTVPDFGAPGSPPPGKAWSTAFRNQVLVLFLLHRWMVSRPCLRGCEDRGPPLTRSHQPLCCPGLCYYEFTAFCFTFHYLRGKTSDF